MGRVLRPHSTSSCTELGNNTLFREIQSCGLMSHTSVVGYTVGSKLLLEEELPASLNLLILGLCTSLFLLCFLYLSSFNNQNC